MRHNPERVPSSWLDVAEICMNVVAFLAGVALLVFLALTVAKVWEKP